MSWLSTIGYGLCLLTGLAAGLIYFRLLAWTTRLHLAGAPLGRQLSLYGLRIAGAGAVFWALAQHGAAALLLTLAGFVLGRIAIQRTVVSGK